MNQVPPLICFRGLTERQRKIMVRHWLIQHDLWDTEGNKPRGCVSVAWDRARGTMTHEFLGNIRVRRANPS